MAQKKMVKREIEVLETDRFVLRDGDRDVIRATVAAAADLQASGVRLDTLAAEDIEIVKGYSLEYMRDDFVLQVPIPAVAEQDDETPAPAEPEVDIVTAKSARVRAVSTSPADIIAAANLARKALLLGRLDAGIAPADADAGIELSVTPDPRIALVVARYPALAPF